ncbi:MAG: undecaprenyl-phosphate glucose phosphotransferase [Clostridia bacterium]|nr:undecaprenyl-phosphate glucose phosphotransferase [Clostridia bacterium]
MQNERRGILDIIEVYIDMLLTLVAILVSYFFAVMIISEEIVPLDSPITVMLIALQLLMSSFVYHALNMYRPTRYQRRYHSFPEALRANLVYYGAMALIIAFVAREGYRGFFLYWVLFAAIMSTAFLTFKRHLIKTVLNAVREKQFNLRKIIIVGDNAYSAKEYVKEINDGAQYGTMILGYVGDKITEDIGVDKLGPFTKLSEILDKYKPTEVVFAIDAYDKRHLIRLVNMCDDRCIKVYFLPVIYGFFKTQRQIEQVGSVPLINIHSTPLDNTANAIMKRALDIVGSLFLIILTSPIMIAAAIGVRLSSPGPIFFRQIRVGKMGKKFMMLKFRSMRVNSFSNKEWTTDTDSRKTKFGNFIRKTSIDELPQLFNVLGGSMSLVGPRPEIPVFVEQFKEVIPLYMVKHYVKPGMTGLAQIKGLRGDTSVEDRIQEDISYIEHWSFWLDIAILLKTPMKAINKNEKYVEEQQEGALLDDETTRPRTTWADPV